MNWWQERCVNRRDFILDHLEERDLNTKEALCLILIDFFNQYQISISHERLAEKLKLPLEQDICILAITAIASPLISTGCWKKANRKRCCFMKIFLLYLKKNLRVRSRKGKWNG